MIYLVLKEELRFARLSPKLGPEEGPLPARDTSRSFTGPVMFLNVTIQAADAAVPKGSRNDSGIETQSRLPVGRPLGSMALPAQRITYSRPDGRTELPGGALQSLRVREMIANG